MTTPGGAAIPNYTVTLQAPTSGASGTFANGAMTLVLTTDATGSASASFSANFTLGGPYTVTGDGGLDGTFSFSLTNLSPSLVIVDVNNPDDMTIAGSSTTVFGVPFTAKVVGNVAVFTILGDLDVPAGDTITATGPYAVEFLVGNNVNIPSTAVFDFAAIGSLAGPGGGGAGGSGGSGGSSPTQVAGSGGANTVRAATAAWAALALTAPSVRQGLQETVEGGLRRVHCRTGNPAEKVFPAQREGLEMLELPPLLAATASMAAWAARAW